MAGELVLLTGGTGFLGFAILVDLLKSGYRVRLAARSQSKVKKVMETPSIRRIDPTAAQLAAVIVPDMTANGAYDEAVDGVDFIIHTAAPVHSTNTPDLPKAQLEELFVQTSVTGSTGILKSAKANGKAVKRVVMTSSTVAIVPPGIYTGAVTQTDDARTPESRVSVSLPPYDSELEAYCASKAASLNASEEFIKVNDTTFDMISILPSWVFGRDELITDANGIKEGTSTKALLSRLMTGDPGSPAIGNAVLCADVAQAHVKALDPTITGNQSFILNTDARWEETATIAKKHFPACFRSGLFKESTQQTVPLNWDSSKAKDVLGIRLATQEVMIREVIEHYLELVQWSET